MPIRQQERHRQIHFHRPQSLESKLISLSFPALSIALHRSGERGTKHFTMVEAVAKLCETELEAVEVGELKISEHSFENYDVLPKLSFLN